MHEIERKFLTSQLPDISNLIGIEYERYFLKVSDIEEIRIQKKWHKYEQEIKKEKNILTSQKEKKEISQKDFELLKQQSIGKIVRTSYIIKKIPLTTLKVYHGKHKGLTRIEVEFSSEQEAKNFKPESWYGKEITNSPLWKDKNIIQLNLQDFKTLLEK